MRSSELEKSPGNLKEGSVGSWRVSRPKVWVWTLSKYWLRITCMRQQRASWKSRKRQKEICSWKTQQPRTRRDFPPFQLNVSHNNAVWTEEHWGLVASRWERVQPALSWEIRSSPQAGYPQGEPDLSKFYLYVWHQITQASGKTHRGLVKNK